MNPRYTAPEVQAARDHAIPHDHVPDPLPEVLAALRETRPDLAEWLAGLNPRPERNDW